VTSVLLGMAAHDSDIPRTFHVAFRVL